MELSRINSLAANPSKFQTMLLKSNSIKDIQLNVTDEDIPLSSFDTMKVLGIDNDDRLTFDGHVSNMCIKVGKDSWTYFIDWRVPLISTAVWQYIRAL